mmetsp:Transcript_24428/g.67141  ORF Transcript_24428/g.67141 Transcript_24428/m.67141 type:complete len:232 (+) Transcript_24428:1561-2256(+)
MGNGCDAPEVLNPAVRARANEYLVHLQVLHLRAWLKAHVREGALHAGALGWVLHLLRIGYAPGNWHDVLGACPPCDCGRNVLGIDVDILVKHGAFVCPQRLPILDGLLPSCTLWRKRPALEVGKSCLVGRDHPRTRARLDRHVADGHAGLHGKALHHLAAEFNDMASAARRANDTNDMQDNVLRGHTLGQLAADLDPHVLLPLHQQRLGGKNMLDLRGSDTERQRTKSPMR